MRMLAPYIFGLTFAAVVAVATSHLIGEAVQRFVALL
jgi:hypothetical protein